MKKLIIAAALVLTATTIRPATYNYELSCLARNIYYEARGEPYLGKLAVAQVTINRYLSKRYADSICGVVFQRRQFSWTATKVREMHNYEEYYQTALETIKGEHKLKDFKALYFHNRQVNPQWNKSRKIVLEVGNHIFYE